MWIRWMYILSGSRSLTIISLFLCGFWVINSPFVFIWLRANFIFHDSLQSSFHQFLFFVSLLKNLQTKINHVPLCENIKFSNWKFSLMNLIYFIKIKHHVIYPREIEKDLVHKNTSWYLWANKRKQMACLLPTSNLICILPSLFLKRSCMMCVTKNKICLFVMTEIHK